MKNLKDTYTKNADRYAGLYRKESKRLFSLSMMRLAVFIGGIALAIVLWRFSIFIAVLTLLAAIIAFAFLLRAYGRHSFRRSFFDKMKEINDDELSSLDNDHSCFEPGKEFIDPQHDFSHDIDLFGDDSVYQYLNRTCTGRGSSLLAQWLSAPDRLVAGMHERQEAVKELSALVEWRQEFNAYGKMNYPSSEEINELMEWLETPPQYRQNRFYGFLRVLMPLLAVALLALAIAGVLPYSLFILIFLINLGIISVNLKKLNVIHGSVSRKHEMLKTLMHLVRHFEDRDFNSPYINSLRKDPGKGNRTASGAILKLSKIIQAFDSRLNMLMAALLNGVLLWDIQCVYSLDKWKKDASSLLPEWFENLGHCDALCSLANYAANNRDYSYPVISEKATYLSAVQMGHPLIDRKERVNNDFTIEARGDINIITGANMAGKSTFLRTVAVNLALAMTGAPVCAREFVYTPAVLFSSMRTTDSLSDNESYFYAELKRLSVLKDRLREGENIFFLLDEILKGTNSRDKSEGSALFIKKIIEYGATGVIATHDVLLGKLEDNYPVIRNKCFEVEIEGDELIFDYILREGMTTRMNAALLMKKMGII